MEIYDIFTYALFPKIWHNTNLLHGFLYEDLSRLSIQIELYLAVITGIMSQSPSNRNPDMHIAGCLWLIVS